MMVVQKYFFLYGLLTTSRLLFSSRHPAVRRRSILAGFFEIAVRRPYAFGRHYMALINPIGMIPRRFDYMVDQHHSDLNTTHEYDPARVW